MAGNWDPLAGVSSDSDNSSDDEEENRANEGEDAGEANPSQEEESQNTDVEKQDKKRIRLEDLQRHGLKDGPSVLLVPKPRGDTADSFPTNWARRDESKDEAPESLEERERTRIAVTGGVEAMAANARKQAGMENLKRLEARQEHRDRKKEVHAQSQKLREESKAMSVKDREKRKRERGQVSRSDTFVENEKNSLRSYGIYSGFDD